MDSKNKKHLRGSTQATIHPLAIILTMALWVLVSIGLGEYCGPHTASSVFLILIINMNYLYTRIMMRNLYMIFRTHETTLNQHGATQLSYFRGVFNVYQYCPPT